MKQVVATMMVFLLFVTALFLGNAYWKQSVQAVTKQAAEASMKEDQQQKEQKDKEDHAAKTWLGKLEPKVAILGGSAAAGTGVSSYEHSWAGLLEQMLKESNPDVTVKNAAVDGYTTADVLGKEVPSIVSFHPDVIIVETASIEDFQKKMNAKDSNANLDKIIVAIKQDNPDARVIVLPSNDSVTLDGKKFNGLTYEEFVAGETNFLKAKGYEYFNVWDTLVQKRKDVNVRLSATLTDGIHLNDKGYELWFAVTKDFFIKK